MNTKMSTLLVAMLTTVLASREASAIQDLAAWNGTVDTLPSGQIDVRNPDSDAWLLSAQWRMSVDYQIGALDGAGPDVFGQIQDFEVDGFGRWWVLDAHSQDLRVFDASGEYVRTVGRSGSGPGEFSNAIALARSAEGNLWVIDPGNGRVSVFDTTGAFLGSHAMPTAGIMTLPWPGGFDRSGSFYALTYLVDQSEESGLAKLMVRHTPSFEPIDSVAPPEPATPAESLDLKGDRGHGSTPIPFTPALKWRLVDGDFWAAETGEYHLVKTGWHGDTLRTIRREFVPLRVTRADIDAYEAELREFFGQSLKIDRSAIPKRMPAIDDFFVDEAGYVWVLRTAAATAPPGSTFDLFDPVGRLLGKVDIPFEVSLYAPPIVRNDYFYAVIEGGLEVQRLVRMRIIR